jgi:hypothetical protein
MPFDQNYLNNPWTQVGVGILGGNYGRNSGEAFANAMKGGLLGMQQAGVSQARQAQTQMAQQQMMMAQAAAKKKQEEEEQMRQWAAAKGLPPNIPEWALKARYEQEVKSQFPGPSTYGTTTVMVRDLATKNIIPMQGSTGGGLHYMDPQGNVVKFDQSKHKLLEQLTPQNLGPWSVPFARYSGYGYGGQSPTPGQGELPPPVSVSEIQTPGGPVTATNYGTADPAEWQAGMQGMQSPQGPQMPPGAMPILPKEVETPDFQAEVAARKKEAEIKAASQAQAQVDLIGADLDMEDIRNKLDELKTHPGKSWEMGKTGYLPDWLGSDRSDFRGRREQILGETFTQVYQQLKGGGSITEIETGQAKVAMNRMETATSEKAFDAAAEDFWKAVQRGHKKLQMKAGNTGDWSFKKVK